MDLQPWQHCKNPSQQIPGALNTISKRLENLFARPYWTIVLILQEVTVASKVRDLWDQLDYMKSVRCY